MLGTRTMSFAIIQLLHGVLAFLIGISLLGICANNKSCTTLNWQCTCEKWTAIATNVWAGFLITILSTIEFCKIKSPSKLPDQTVLVIGLLGALVSSVAFGLQVTAAATTPVTVSSFLAHVILHSLGSVIFCSSAICFFVGICAKESDDNDSSVGKIVRRGGDDRSKKRTAESCVIENEDRSLRGSESDRTPHLDTTAIKPVAASTMV